MNIQNSECLILNVDDTDAARYARTRVLTRAGFRVIEAAGGQEALDLARSDKPDLILLDVKLPDINGFEVCRRLKEDAETRHILVLQTSASYIASADKIRALEGGADNYLFEPIEPEELVANARALLRLGRVERELREADRRKDVFLATLAHELRNPLAPIRTSAELLGLDGAGSSQVQEQARTVILRQTDHMVRLVDDLLDVSRIATGKIVLRPEAVCVQSLVAAAAETAAPVIADSGHALALEMPEEEIWINGDRVRITQVIGNLLQNAAKFTPPGGRIKISVGVRDDQVLIDVADNGVGLSPEQMDSVFEMFVQATPVPGGSHQGLGIGLSLAKGLMALHGGSISASSNGKDQGATFQVRLPFGATATGSIRPAATERAGAPAPCRVLVVDDNVDCGTLLTTLLEALGYTTALAHSGTDALALARAFAPDAAILDIDLPDMSGYELARSLRGNAAGKPLRLVACTGYGTREDKDHARQAGFDAHLTKPASAASLTAALSAAGSEGREGFFAA